MEILKHRLVDGGVQHLVCRKNSRKLSGSDMIVVHYTAGTSARTAAEFLAKEEVKASAHLVIGRQGELFQLVPFDTEAWHAGRSCYGGRANLNRYSIGIELDNLGRLQLQEGRFVAECGVEVAPADVYVDEYLIDVDDLIFFAPGNMPVTETTLSHPLRRRTFGYHRPETGPRS